MVAKRFVKLCLPTKTSREIATEYTVDAFAVRTTDAVSKEFVYTPATDLEVSADGTKLCAKITEFNTLYCPVKLASSWETASTDVGSANCEATNKLVELQEASKSRAKATVAKDIAEDEALEKCASVGDCSAAESIADSASDSASDSGTDQALLESPVSAAAPTFSFFSTALAAALVTLFA